MTYIGFNVNSKESFAVNGVVVAKPNNILLQGAPKRTELKYLGKNNNCLYWELLAPATVLLYSTFLAENQLITDDRPELPYTTPGLASIKDKQQGIIVWANETMQSKVYTRLGTTLLGGMIDDLMYGALSVGLTEPNTG